MKLGDIFTPADWLAHLPRVTMAGTIRLRAAEENIMASRFAARCEEHNVYMNEVSELL